MDDDATTRSDGRDAFERGDALARRGDLTAAADAYREADSQGHGAAAAKLGALLEAEGDRDGAREAYGRADERGDGYGALRLGLLLAAGNEWDDARAAFDRAQERGVQPEGADVSAVLRAREEAPAAPRPALAPLATLSNPVLVGAMTTLVLLVAVFLAYNANAGLPFVPTKELKVDIASGSDLVVGNEVREGGYRIGLVQSMKPIELPTGRLAAQLVLQLDEQYGKVPVDSTAAIRPRSLLGLKYVDLELGHSRQLFDDGATMPISQTHVPVQFEDINEAFDPKTRRAIQSNLVGYGDALAARGSALNDTIASLPSLLGHLRPVAQYLADPSTELIRFFNNLEGFMGTVAPVAGIQARLFTDMATTFAAIGRSPQDLEATIAKSPSTEQVSTQSLAVQRPFLRDLDVLGAQLVPATASLRTALPVINPAIQQGTRTLIRTPVLNSKLQGTMSALRALAQAPGTNVGINALDATVNILNPMVRYLGPYQTVCDYWDYFWTFLSEHISEQTAFGFAQRVLLNFGNPTQANNIGQQGAISPVNGGGTDSLFGGNEYLHSQNYGAAIDTNGNADCETGQRGYPRMLNAADPLKRTLALDPHTPGAQGPTYHGRTHVPAGETFTRTPQTGPQLAANPSNP